jgi:hypothetical protein
MDLARELAGTAYLLLPLLGGAAVHGACLRFGWLDALARPIDGGRRLGGRPIFGHSKTFRGPVTVALGAAAVHALQRDVLHGWAPIAGIELVDYAALPGVWLGALAGGVAELFELPNSFTKRRLDIEPGGTTGGAAGVVFYLWDQLDLLVGYWLVLAPFVPPTPLRVGASIVVVGAIHPLLTVLGWLLGMRPTPR